ncbi:hypothetical protein ASPFODRAFT_143452 [Aspergillus luchuensis CBS 106.47]|uniref:Uncharacterized protein n=1 Tax=Aspergillus luchuensis (strain CBS 106.47) TaxID=1137211 RepID=A0A1M3T6D5_ASPLC|nr:hypothetical protein ASPFODRAFT_143452 [Aspergillus luchuensis CBS 106.47]
MGDRSAVTRSLHLDEWKGMAVSRRASVLMTLRMGVYNRDKETPRYRGESRGRSLINRRECSGWLADGEGRAQSDESATFPPMQPHSFQFTHSLTHSLAPVFGFWLCGLLLDLFAFPIVVEISVSAYGSRTPSQRCSFHG